jgi:hypothetical protein
MPFEALAKAADENRSISPEEASSLQKILDEGKQISSKRLQFLKVAHVEGWEVAKCMEKSTFPMELVEDTQKQLKRARKDAKALETEKKEKKSDNAHNNMWGFSSEGIAVVAVAMVVSEEAMDVVLLVVMVACSGEALGLVSLVVRQAIFQHIAYREVCMQHMLIDRWPRSGCILGGRSLLFSSTVIERFLREYFKSRLFPEGFSNLVLSQALGPQSCSNTPDIIDLFKHELKVVLP